MPKQGYYITSKGEWVDITDRHFRGDLKVFNISYHVKDANRLDIDGHSGLYRVLNVSNMDAVELVVPDNIDGLYCRNNKLTKLVIPDGARWLYCQNNEITNLVLPDSIEELYCDLNAIDVTKYNSNKDKTNLMLYI